MELQVVLFLLLHFTAAASDRVLIVSPSPANCSQYHQETCHALSEYAHNTDKYVNESTKFVFLPGNHYLDTDLNISNISSLVLSGSDSSHTGLISKVVCTNYNATVAIANVSCLLISSLEFTCFCGNNMIVIVENIRNATLTLFHLLYSTRLSICNSTALLKETLFASTTTGQCFDTLISITSNSSIMLSGTNLINNSYCYYGLFSIENTTLTLLPNSNMKFLNNNNNYGLLMSWSLLTLMSNSSILFVQNTLSASALTAIFSIVNFNQTEASMSFIN